MLRIFPSSRKENSCLFVDWVVFCLFLCLLLPCHWNCQDEAVYSLSGCVTTCLIHKVSYLALRLWNVFVLLEGIHKLYDCKTTMQSGPFSGHMADSGCPLPCLCPWWEQHKSPSFPTLVSPGLREKSPDHRPTINFALPEGRKTNTPKHFYCLLN